MLKAMASLLGMLWLIFSGSALSQNFEYLSSTLFTGPLNAVQADGDYAYFIGRYALQVFDISDPASPILVAESTSPEYHGAEPSDFIIASGYAYVIYGFDSSSYLQIFDINDPFYPQPTGGCEIPEVSDAESICISGQYAFVAGDGFGTIDISDPNSPAQIGSCILPDYGYDVEVSGSYSFVADGGSDLQVIDISDPYQPEVVTHLPLPGSETWGLCISGEYVYTTSEGYFHAVNITNPAEPYIAGTLEADLFENSIVVVQNNIAYVAQGGHLYQSGLLIIDVSDPESPSLIEQYNRLGYTTDVFVISNFAIINWNDEPWEWYWSYGFQIVDITSPSDPVPIGQYQTPGCLYGVLGVCAQDNLAYVGAGGFYILDVSNPLFPRHISTLSLSETQEFVDIFVSGDFAYCFIIDEFDPYVYLKFAIIDVSDSTNPSLVEEYIDFGGRFCLYGDYIFMTGSDLSIFDVSNPFESELITTYPDGAGRDICVAGDYAYVSGSVPELLKVIDVSDVMNPVIVRIYSGQSRESGRCISISENHVLIGISDTNLHHYLKIFDISDPLDPQFSSSISLPDHTSDILIYENCAFVSCGSTGLQIIDISDISNPELVGIYDTPGHAVKSYASDNIFYVADIHSLQILQYEPETGIEFLNDIPVNYELSQNYPNPFNSSTTIRYSLPEPSDIRIEIHNIIGQRVATIFDGYKEAGYHKFTWYAGDYPSGLYFYRIEAGEYAKTSKMVLLK